MGIGGHILVHGGDLPGLAVVQHERPADRQLGRTKIALRPAARDRHGVGTGQAGTRIALQHLEREEREKCTVHIQYFHFPDIGLSGAFPLDQRTAIVAKAAPGLHFRQFLRSIGSDDRAGHRHLVVVAAKFDVRHWPHNAFRQRIPAVIAEFVTYKQCKQ